MNFGGYGGWVWNLSVVLLFVFRDQKQVKTKFLERIRCRYFFFLKGNCPFINKTNKPLVSKCPSIMRKLKYILKSK